MSDERWIVIPGWDRFQHYTDRDPVWIKVYTELVHNPDFIDLALADRGLLTTLWVLYARTLGQLSVPRARDFLPARYPLRHFLRSLESLNDAGFIEFSASKPLALARSREKRREEKKENRANALANQEPEDARNGALEPVGVSVDAKMVALARGWLQTHAPTDEDEEEDLF